MTGLHGELVGGSPSTAPASSGRGIERNVSRVLSVGSYASVACLGFGLLAMLAAGVSPLSPDHPELDFARLPADALALRPAGVLWLGIVIAVAMPATRVVASLVGYAVEGDRRMAAISVGILCVIALGVIVTMATA